MLGALGNRRNLVAPLAVALGTAAGLVAFPAAAAPPRVTITLGGYGQPAPPGSQSAPVASATQASLNAALQTQAAFAQGIAYDRYLQYVAAVTAQTGRNPPAYPKDYFTNGASATEVPSSGPAAAYFTNGAEPPPVASPAAAAPPGPPPPPPNLPPAAPLAPFWWVDSPNASPPAPSAAPLPPPPAAPPPAPAADAPPPAPAMSFEEWLQSMGAEPQDTEPEPAALAEAPVEAEPSSFVAEPAAASFDVRARAPHAAREKAREHAAAPADERGELVVVILGTFGAGLALGALAMKRGALRARTEL